MEKQRFWRTLFVVLLTVFSILYILPTLMPADSLPKWYPFKKELKFGLDIKGGLELRYSVDYKKAILEHTRDLMFRTQEYLVRKTKGKEYSDKITPEELAEIRDVAKFTVPAFDTVSIVTTDEGILDLLTKEALEKDIDPRYIKVEEGDAILLVMNPKEVKQIRTETVSQTLTIIRKRIEASGLVEPDVRAAGETDIDVQLPGVKKAEMDRVREMIGKTARLTFRIVDNKSDFFNDVKGDLETFKQEKGGTSLKNMSIERFGDRHQVRADKKSHLVAFTQYLRKIGKLPDDHVVGYYEVQDRDKAGRVISAYYRTEYLHGEVKVSGEHLARARVFYKDTGEPYVSLTFNSRGGKLFGEVTSDNVGQYMAIMLDDDINSAPVIKEAITGGQAQISLGGDKSSQELMAEAQSLVTVLTHGAYKAPVHKIQDHEVGPTLGKDSIDAAVWSLIVGAALVILFMLLYYGMAGIIADIALILNMIFILAILIAFNSALTLPGLAGIVLTVGMAVDANVIIYERIREELRAGKAPRPAIETGYEKSTWTIIDAQLTTALAGLILLNFTTGPIYGFAVTLLIGIVCSVFTALFISKLIFGWLLSKKIIKEKVRI